MTRRALFLALLLLIIIMPLPAFADDGYFGGTGEIPIPRNSDDIAMKSEVVNVILHQGFAEVECAYQFKNHGDEQKVVMGFPERPSMEGDYVPITIFKAYVDGAEVPVKKTKVTLNPGQYGYDQFEATSNWFLQEIPFKTGETKVVVNGYLSPNGGTVSPDASYTTHFAYILHTGSTWMGRISRADVNITFASDFLWGNFKPDPKAYAAAKQELPGSDRIKPKGYKKLEDGLNWTFSNIEPQADADDIILTFYRNKAPGGATPLDASADAYLVAGEFKYPAEQAFDGDIMTAWAGREADSGIGQSIKASFKQPCDIAEIRILPGYAKRSDLFTKYSRPKKLTLSFSDGTKRHIELADDPRVQYIALDKPVKATWAKFTIDEVYKGSVGDNTYITEIEFAPKPTRTVVSAEEILTGAKGPSSAIPWATSGTSKAGELAQSIKNISAKSSSQSTSSASSDTTRSASGQPKRPGEKTSPPNSLPLALGAFAFGAVVALIIVFNPKRKEQSEKEQP